MSFTPPVGSAQIRVPSLGALSIRSVTPRRMPSMDKHSARAMEGALVPDQEDALQGKPPALV